MTADDFRSLPHYQMTATLYTVLPLTTSLLYLTIVPHDCASLLYLTIAPHYCTALATALLQ